MTRIDRWKSLIAATVVAVALAAAPAAHAASVVAVAGPEAEHVGFATPVVVVPAGSGVTLVNADPASYFHNMWSVQHFPPGAATAPWCGDFGPTTCPLFVSDLIDDGQTTEVRGVASLPPGTYGFICTIHGSMSGQLIVEAT